MSAGILGTSRSEALLVLGDGETFEGEAIGAYPEDGVATGEAVFNTVLSGYQEVITDPSYAGQVIAFTYPHIGNYGVNPTDDEAPRPHCKGIIVRDLAERPSSWRATGSLEEFLVRHSIPGMTGVDTRRLTRHLRDQGAMPCAFGTASRSVIAEAAAVARPTDGIDLVSGVSATTTAVRGSGPYRVVAYDFGIKEAMMRQLADFATLSIVPAHTPAAEVLGWEPDGIFLSNGPGDPAALPRRRRADPRACSPTDRSRSSASASVTSSSPPRSGRAPTSCPSATTVATIRCNGWRPARSRSPRRTTTTRSRSTRPPRSRSPTST